MSKIAMAVTMAAGVLTAFGADSTWTGAVDGCWTNAANWTAGVPGRYYAPDGTLTGATAETATFGATAGATTIDLDGVFSIGEVIVTGAGPRYTFGASATQILPLEAIFGGAKNKMTVEASVTQAPVIRAILQFGKGNDGGNVNVLLANNSADTLVVNDFGYMQGTKRIYGRFAGTGPIRVDGVWIPAPSGAVPNAQSYISTGTATGVTFTKSFTFPGLLNSGAANAKIVIAGSVKITMSNGAAWGDLGTPPMTFDGPGELSVTCSGFAQLVDRPGGDTFVEALGPLGGGGCLLLAHSSSASTGRRVAPTPSWVAAFLSVRSRTAASTPAGSETSAISR